MALNAKQERFAKEYAIDANATQAAIRAGYSEHTAYSQGQRLLKDVEISSRIAELTTELSGDIELTAEKVIRELTRVGMGDLRSVASWNEAGLTVKSSEDLNDASAATVKSIKSTHTRDRDGTERTTLEVAQHDKIRALELLGKRFALFTDRVQQTSEGEVRIKMLGLPDKSRGDGSAAPTGGTAQGELKYADDSN